MTAAHQNETQPGTKLLVIAGSTATGKTGAALALARTLDGELIGADSVQVYRGFDIGSAKPTLEELDGVAHHMIDIVDPTERIDAMDFAHRADAVIADVVRRGKLPIVVGGTGLWIRALVRGLVALPPVDHALRNRLLEEGETLGREALHARLAKVDPITAEAVHPRDLVRVSRALEVWEQTGTPLGELRRAHALGGPRYDSHFVALQRTEDHDARIDKRLDAMLEGGWLEETQGLLQRWPKTARAFGSVGYAQLVQYIDGVLPWDETRARIRKVTRVYARRQRTWFGGEPGIDERTTREQLVSPDKLRFLEAWR